MGWHWRLGVTCEGGEDPEAPADLIEDVVPDAAAALEAALGDVQYVVPPEGPAAAMSCPENLAGHTAAAEAVLLPSSSDTRLHLHWRLRVSGM